METKIHFNFWKGSRLHSYFGLLTTILWLIMSNLSFSKHLQSQEIVVSGQVVQIEKNEPIRGVSIEEKNSKNATSTDLNGNFTIKVKSGAVLLFSAVGFITQEVEASSPTLLISLQESSTDIDAVVVVGYGKQKSSNITSAIASIKAEDFDERPTSRIDHAMAGKLPGVQVQEVSGSPGKSLNVKVRGVSSISNSNAPLYVVDGYPVSSGLDNISPNDIESIEVLKDAASAAIYGSRGANGVVLITTKAGKTGAPSIQLNTSFGLQDRFSKVDVLNRDEYIQFAIEERNNTWMLQGGKASDPNSTRTNANYWIDPLWLTDPTSFPDHDWQDLISRKAGVQNYQLSATGGTDAVKYFASANYFDQKGIILGSDYKRLSFRTNVETKVHNRISLGINLSANALRKNDSDGDGNQGPVSRSTRVAPIVGLDQQTQIGGYYPYHAAFYLNPIALAKEIRNFGNTKHLLANIYANIEILENLTFRTSFGTDYSNYFSQFFKPDNVNRGVGHTGNFTSNYRENYLNENLLSYDLNKKDWTLNAIAGFTYQQEKYVDGSLSKSGFPDDEIKTLNMGTILSSGASSETEWNLISFLSRANFAFKDRYLVSASIRRDGSSRFGADNKWGWFPAASVGWRISKEKFMSDVSFINELKLRASYGNTGNNNIGNYASIGALNAANYVLGTSQAVSPGFAPGSFSNRNLGWEKTTTVDVGLDLSILQSRINIGVDYYSSDVKDLLLNVQTPPISGFSTALLNIGSIRNTGYEILLNTENIRGPFTWSTNFNISHNKNKVLALGVDNSPIYGSQEGFIVTKTEVGQPIGSYYLFTQEGVFKNQEELNNHPHYRVQNVGDIKYKDLNNDKVIDEDDKSLVGNNNPKYFWGMQHHFSYHNWDLNVSLDGQWGNKLLNIGISQHGQSRGNVDGYWRDRWRSPEEPGNGWTPRAAVTANLTTPSTFWLRNASFWRIRTISLGYKLPKSTLNKWKILDNLRIYGSIDNVFMHDHYNKNPQTGSFTNSNTIPGVDYDAAYPLARTYTIGLNVKF